jgi:hypothetical protein
MPILCNSCKEKRETWILKILIKKPSQKKLSSITFVTFKLIDHVQCIVCVNVSIFARKVQGKMMNIDFDISCKIYLHKMNYYLQNIHNFQDK